MRQDLFYGKLQMRRITGGRINRIKSMVRMAHKANAADIVTAFQKISCTRSRATFNRGYKF